MQYKLIHNKTKEETICSLVTIDDFDYYYFDELIPYNPNGGTNGNFVCLGEIESNKQYNVKLGDKQYISPFVKNVGSCGGCRRLIATNNPNIDIPKIYNDFDDVDHLSSTRQFENLDRNIGFILGYSEAKETYQYTEEDMIKFGYLCRYITKYNKDVLRNNPDITEKELLSIWKKQQSKTLYYES